MKHTLCAAGRLASMTALTFLLMGLLGCAASPTPEEVEAERQQAMARRIDEICVLPEAERDAELERLKKEAGLVLYCGKEKD